MKEYAAIFISLLVGITAHHEVHLVPAHKICPDVSGDHDILLPDPKDCSVYYRCENGTAIPQSCPPGLAWCQILQNCTLPILANCTLSHTIVTYSPEELVTYNPNSTTTEKPVTRPTTSSETCPKDGASVPNPEDCRKYYKCKKGKQHPERCHGKKRYSTWLGICTAPEIANCINVGTQVNKTCPVNGARNVYPSDCSKYYECVGNTVEIKQCPSGKEYNKWFKDCYSPKLAYCHRYTTVSPTTLRTTTQTPGPDNTCPEYGYKLPNPLNCTTYYVCENNSPTLQNCPTGFEYSCWNQECLPPSDSQCLPTQGQSCKNSEEKLPNSQDCHSYYECQNGTTVKKHCKRGLQYNSWFKKCVHSNVAHCKVEGTTTPTTISTNPPHTPSPSGTTDICPIDGAKLPDPLDCHSYYVCKNETPIKKTCPRDMEYSCWDLECLPAESANCINKINQTGHACKNDSTTMPNINDCSSYYKCENGKVVLVNCDNGLEFNSWYGKCVKSSLSHCNSRTTENLHTTPTTTGRPSPLCPRSGLQYPSSKYCNAYMICDSNRQLKTVECNPSTFHYNCETKTCENITHCCSHITQTMPPSTEGSITTGGDSSETTTASVGPTGSSSETTAVSGGPTGGSSETTAASGGPTGSSETTAASGGPTGGSTETTAASGGPTGGSSETTAASGGPPGGSTETTAASDGPTGGSTETTAASGGPTGGSTETTAASGGPTGGSSETTAASGGPTGGSSETTAASGGPTEGSTETTAASGGPTGGSSETTAASGGPTGGSTETTAASGGPTGGSTETTAASGRPTGGSSETTAASGGPIEGSSETTAASGGPTGGSSETTAASGGPTGSSSETTEISGGPTEGSSETTAASGGPTGGSTETTAASGGPTGGSTETTVASGGPTEGSTETTAASGGPTEGSSETTAASGRPTGSSSETTEISGGSTGGSSETTAASGGPTGGSSETTAGSGGSTGSSSETTEISVGPTEGSSETTAASGGPTGGSSETTAASGGPTGSSSETTEISGGPTGGSSETTTASGEPTGGSTETTAASGGPTGSSSETTAASGEPTRGSTETTAASGGPTDGSSSGTPNMLCPQSGLQYPSSKYCNAYMICDHNRQLKTVECSPSIFHYNCETKKCENITHCCSQNTQTMPPSTEDSVTTGGSTRDSSETTAVSGGPTLSSSETTAASGGPTGGSSETTAVSGGPTAGSSETTEISGGPTGGSSETTEISGGPTGGSSETTAASGGPTGGSTETTEISGGPTEGSSATTAASGGPTGGSSETTAASGEPTGSSSETTEISGGPTLSSSETTAASGGPTGGSSETTAVSGGPTAGSSETTEISGGPTGGSSETTEISGGPTGGSSETTAASGGPTGGSTETTEISGGPTEGSSATTAASGGPTGGSSETTTASGEPTGSSSETTEISGGPTGGSSETTAVSGGPTGGSSETTAASGGPTGSSSETTAASGELTGSSSETTAPTGESTDPTSPTEENDVCPLEGALLPNPIDCATYYKCINGTPTLEKCPDGKKYSCWVQRCELDSEATCVSEGGQNGQNCSVEGLRIIDVTNCNNYYECHKGTTILKQCPHGQEFNANFKKCYKPKLAHCHTYSTITPKPATETTPPTSTISPHNDICPVDGTLLPNPLNCSAYYKCINGTPTPELCADGYEYSCWNQVCEPAGEAQCITNGIKNNTSCKNNGQKIQNPEDCHSYYECVNGKVKSKRCLLNWYYNKWFHICVPLEILGHCKPTTITIPPTTLPATTPKPSTNDICPKDGALLPNPIDCAGYYKCVNSQPTPQKCPSGQEYSCWNQKCEIASNAQCINDGIQPGQNCSRDGVRLQNLESCSSYYECQNGIVEVKYCFIGFQYNRWYQKCVHHRFAHCKTSPIKTTSTTTQAPGTPSAEYDVCPFEGALLPNPVDCTTYYQCVNSTPTLQKCPDGQAYSCWDQKCELDTKAVCIATGSHDGANCTVDKLRLHNLEDCSSYYECVNGKTVLKHCPPGEEFNDRFQQCYKSVFAHCQTYSTLPTSTGTPSSTYTPSPGNDICPVDGTLLPNPVNCSTYFKCINGTPTPELCADGYEYDCWNQACEPKGVAQCISEGSQTGKSCKNNGNKNLDPTNCHGYLECVNHVIVHKQCPLNWWYNKWFKYCLPLKILAHCHEVTTIAPVTTSLTTVKPTGSDECPSEGTVIPNPKDCSTYLKCIKNKPTIQNCPKGQKYSAYDQQCKTGSEVTCINDGIPPQGRKCSRDGVRIQNLVDCTSYYECKDGIVQKNYCFIGFKYNRWYQRCQFKIFSHCETYSTHAPPKTTSKPSTTAGGSLTSTVRYPNAICSGNGVKVPNVNNCNQYYYCSGITPVLYNCPPGQNYDAWEEVCLPVSQARCINNPQSWVGERCSMKKETVPDATSCQNYYICRGKKIRSVHCPHRHQYSVWQGRCLFDDLATCATKIV